MTLQGGVERGQAKTDEMDLEYVPLHDAFAIMHVAFGVMHDSQSSEVWPQTMRLR